MVLVSSCWIFLFEWKWVFSYFEIPDLFGKLNFESRKNPVDPTQERERLLLVLVLRDLRPPNSVDIRHSNGVDFEDYSRKAFADFQSLMRHMDENLMYFYSYIHRV